MTSYCASCGCELVKLPRTRPRDFLKRRCCSRACAGRLAVFTRNSERIIPNASVRDPSLELLRRLVIYGLRHDGLPGLPANDLLQLAAEFEVAA